MKKIENFVYLDNAATSWPKPACVGAAMTHAMMEHGGNPGRGSHPLAEAAARLVYGCREEIALFFGSQPENVIFTYNATYALNMVIQCTIGAGEHFMISNAEHNSVYRPATALETKGAKLDIYNAFVPPWQVVEQVSGILRHNTRAVVATHSCNICPLTLPIRELGALCRRKGVFFVVDAAQSAGREEINMKRDNIDALCLAGHKGLLGPQGVGVIILSDALKEHLAARHTLIQGGSGMNSLDLHMPAIFPERFEAGTPATPAIAGLLAGVEYVGQLGSDNIRRQENAVFTRIREILLANPKIQLYMPEATEGSVLLFNIDRIPAEVAVDKFAEGGVYLRGGWHCNPLAHRQLGTLGSGAVRVGIGYANTLECAEKFGEVLGEI